MDYKQAQEALERLKSSDALFGFDLDYFFGKELELLQEFINEMNPATVKCKHCGEEISKVRCHVFNHAGGDDYADIEIQGGKEEGECYYLRGVSKDLTMFEFEDCYDDFISNISCPCCDGYPFEEKSISIYETADVVFGISDERGFE
ncbi:hypothetical protein LJC02_01820 [Breznakia sp. OttesenSCG-928-G09]|nr:hypothetical protein [Breznakia sp. OttesenSCG-928-G09]